jgi:hypothetical protein
MAFAENETVAQGGLGLCGVKLQHSEEQRCQDVGDREIAANVTEAGAADHLDHASADIRRLLLEALRALDCIHRLRQCGAQARCLFGCYR